MINNPSRHLAPQQRASKEQKERLIADVHQKVTKRINTQQFFEGNWLMAGTVDHFRAALSSGDSIVPILEERFPSKLARTPKKGEVESWKATEESLLLPLIGSDMSEEMMILEYCLPALGKQNPNYTNRLDVLICGTDSSGQDWIVAIETKQWDRFRIRKAEKENHIWLGEGERMRNLLHPALKQKNAISSLKDVIRWQGRPEDYLQFDNICMFLNKERFTDADSVLFDESFIANNEVSYFHKNSIKEMIERIKSKTGYDRKRNSSLFKLHCLNDFHSAARMIR